MSFERTHPWKTKEIKPAAETEKDVPERLRHLHEVEGKFLTKGVFFDVYAIEMPNSKGGADPFVFKNFRSGDVTMPLEEQVALFQHQYYEWVQLRHLVGKKFFPESYWIRSGAFTEDQAHGFFTKPGDTANTMGEYIKVQLDRQLTNRYSSDDKKKGAMKKFLKHVGDVAVSQHGEKPFVGAIVQARVHGVPFEKALKKLDKSSPVYDALRDNVQELLHGLRAYNDASEHTAFTWHGLGSDNVMAETHEGGQPTGNVYIVDANFTERPNKTFKKYVVSKWRKEVLEPLTKALDLD